MQQKNKSPLWGDMKRREQMTTKSQKVFMVRLLEKLLVAIIMGVCLAGVIIAICGNNKISDLEKTIQEDDYQYEERIPVKEQMADYIKSLPLPIIENSLSSTIIKVFAEDSGNDSRKFGKRDDILLLAQLMHAEEGILRTRLSKEDAKMAHMFAGSVILHRKDMNYRGAKTIKDVIYMPGQYACIENLEQEIPEETIQWARELIENGPLGPQNMIYQAQFEQGSETIAHIDNQYFCCE